MKAFLIALALCLSGGQVAKCGALWKLGENDGNVWPFGEESRTRNPAPGSALAKDDDYYFAGVFPPPIGKVDADERLSNFERSLTHQDETNRIHFVLGESLDTSTHYFALDFGTQFAALDSGSQTWLISLNGVTLFHEEIGPNSDVSVPFTTAEVPLVVGENVLAMQRDLAVAHSAAWLNIDYMHFRAVQPGDYNFDDSVDAADYAVWRDTVGSTYDLRANGDDSGASAKVIDESDYAFWRTHFGESIRSSSPIASAIPEPGTELLVIVGIVVGSQFYRFRFVAQSNLPSDRRQNKSQELVPDTKAFRTSFNF